MPAPVTTTVEVEFNNKKYPIRVVAQYRNNQTVGLLLIQGEDQISLTLDSIPSFVAAVNAHLEGLNP